MTRSTSPPRPAARSARRTIARAAARRPPRPGHRSGGVRRRIASTAERTRCCGAASGPCPAAPVLDLGCGYGPIALTLARRNPAVTVWAVDVNERARDLCAENARDGRAPPTCGWRRPDDVPG